MSFAYYQPKIDEVYSNHRLDFFSWGIDYGAPVRIGIKTISKSEPKLSQLDREILKVVLDLLVLHRNSLLRISSE